MKRQAASEQRDAQAAAAPPLRSGSSAGYNSFEDAVHTAKRLRTGSEDSPTHAPFMGLPMHSTTAGLDLGQFWQSAPQAFPAMPHFMRFPTAPFLFPHAAVGESQHSQHQHTHHSEHAAAFLQHHHHQQLLQQHQQHQQLLAALAGAGAGVPNRQPPLAPAAPLKSLPHPLMHALPPQQHALQQLLPAQLGLQPPAPAPRSPLSLVPLPSRRVRAKQVQKSSRFRGVYWDKAARMWAARVIVDGKPVPLGRFAEETDAARAYDESVVRFHGADAETNFAGSSAASSACASQPSQQSHPRADSGALTDEGSVLPEQPSAPVSPAAAPVSRAASGAAGPGKTSVAAADVPPAGGKRARGAPSSAYRGVCWNKCNRSWKASIKVNGRNTHIGYYDDVHEAALAYDLKAMEVRGDRAVLNFRHGRMQHALA